jgi:hypothetical protein
LNCQLAYGKELGTLEYPNIAGITTGLDSFFAFLFARWTYTHLLILKAKIIDQIS